MKTLTLGVLVLLTLVACQANDPDGDGAQVVTSGAAPDTTQPAQETSTQATVTTEPSTTTSPALGTRQNPLDPGVTVRVGDWEVTYIGAVLDATDLVLTENPFNDPPEDGRQFVFLEFEGTYVGEDSGTWLVDVSANILGSQANTFGQLASLDDYCGVIPDAIGDTSETFPGGQVAGNECVSVPSDQLDGALVFVESLFSFDDSDRTFYRINTR